MQPNGIERQMDELLPKRQQTLKEWQVFSKHLQTPEEKP
jgi:hypothetical protein